MRQLKFLTPRYDSFVNYLCELLAEEARPILLVGNNDLAVKIQSAVKEKKIDCICADNLNDKNLDGTKGIVVFTETSGELLSSQLMYCIGSDDVMVVAPITDWHFSKKPLFLVSIPKAGTHLVYELAKSLGYKPGIELLDIPLGQTWYCVEYTNSHTVARDFFVDSVRHAPFGNRHHPFMHSPALFIYRHPLDILVSEANYYHLDGKTSFSGWLSQYDFAGRVEQLVKDNWLIGSLRKRVGSFLLWMDFPNVIPFSFEELIGVAGGGNEEDQVKLIWSIQLKLQAPGSPNKIASQVFNPDSPTFRSALIGKYCDDLSSDIISDFCINNKDILESLGYPYDGSFKISNLKEKWLNKPIKYSKINYSNMPINVEADFLECNLVRFNERFYAVPMSAGLINLNNLSLDNLAVLPSAESVKDLKVLLTLGLPMMSCRVKALHHLGVMLREGNFDDGFEGYWSDSSELKVLENHKGYNIVEYNDRYFALKSSVGEIDIVHNSLEKLKQQHGENTVFMANSIAGVQNEINVIIASDSLRQEIVTSNEKALTMIKSLKDDQEKLTKQFAVQEKQLKLMQLTRVSRLKERINQFFRKRKK